MGDALNHVDLYFVVDTTGSMQPFISAAQAALLDTVEALGARSGVEIQVGLVEFRDHPPQEMSFVTRHYPLTADLGEMRKVINGLRADGGGDPPEAVYDGVQEAAVLTEWRVHSCRFILLVGDAPPHGYAPPRVIEEAAAATRPTGRRASRARARCRGRGRRDESLLLRPRRRAGDGRGRGAPRDGARAPDERQRSDEGGVHRIGPGDRRRVRGALRRGRGRRPHRPDARRGVP
jgi:hypothetical protein